MIATRRVVFVDHRFKTGARRSYLPSVQVPQLGGGRGRSRLLSKMFAKVGVGLLCFGELQTKRFFGEEVAEVRRKYRRGQL